MTSTDAAPLVQTGLLDLVLQSGPVAKLVLLTLLGSSVASWGIIFSKWRTLREAAVENDEFLELFWHGKTLDEIHARSEQFGRSPVAAVFDHGVKELRKITASSGAADPRHIDPGSLENIARALARQSNDEIAELESRVGWLATVASATPFVGLFGTVWGIMNSFQGIGAAGGANLAVVAPGISEALVTTAAGIAAAVPAVVAYNHFAGRIKRMATDMDSFCQDFLNIISRSLLQNSGGAGRTRGGS